MKPNEDNIMIEEVMIEIIKKICCEFTTIRYSREVFEIRSCRGRYVC